MEAVHSKDTPQEAMAYFVYAASKTAQEREFWKWGKENQHDFAMNAVLPNMNVSSTSGRQEYKYPSC
jgi:hypothetical protein